MRFADPEGFDTIVTIETIEHLPNTVQFVSRIAGMLRPGGILIASVPTTPSVDGNPYHLHDFTERSFRRLFDRQLEQEGLKMHRQTKAERDAWKAAFQQPVIDGLLAASDDAEATRQLIQQIQDLYP